MNHDELRSALGCFPTGVVVAATLSAEGNPVGLTVNSFNSVSLTPPLILWSLSLSAPCFPVFRSATGFAVNILSFEQAELCHRFASPARDKFAGVDWHLGKHGQPLLTDAHATLECRVWRRYEGGDHEIILGEVLALHIVDCMPLVYHRGRLSNVAVHASAYRPGGMRGI